jgi:SNF2 family DNA or RNA helicase
MPPLPHQIPGALAVAAGHTLLADEPGMGKTLTSLLAAAVDGAERVFVACPPKVATHWGREVVKTGLAAEEQIVVVQAGRKVPPIDEAKVVVVPYSMLTERPSIGAQVAYWQPQWIIADEAHLLKTPTSARAEAMLRLKADVPSARTVALTGTPVMSGPQELVSLLEFTGHLSSVFGGSSAFLGRYCRQDQHGKWHANKRTLRELNRKLVDHVWVRRTKEQVLRDLPEPEITIFDQSVDLAQYEQTHREILERIDGWVQKTIDDTGRLPNAAEVDEYVDTAIEFVSWLRRAAGKAKVPAVLEMIRAHQAEADRSGQERPLLVWAHHSDVIEALQEATGGAPALTGATSKRAADRLIDSFQAGEVPLLICSIMAVGAGITLTRGSDAIFAEFDWTPAQMQQAVDRQRRIGQLRTVKVQIPVAVGTLDEHAVRILGDKAEIVAAVLGDAGAEQFRMERVEKVTPARLVKRLIGERVQVRGARGSSGGI